MGIEKEEKSLTILLKLTKTDIEKKGVLVFVGCTEKKVCAYSLMVKYLDSKSSSEPDDLLFSDFLGYPLTRSYFVSTVRLLLMLCGLDPKSFSGHSFRAGS